MSRSNRKVYTKYLYLIEKSIRKVYMKCSISNRKIYNKSLDLIDKSIQNIDI